MARKKQENPKRDAKTIPQKIARKQMIGQPFPILAAKSQARREGRKQLIAGTQTDEDSSAREKKGSLPFLARNIRQSAGAVMTGRTSDLSQVKKSLAEAEQLSKDLSRQQFAELLREIDKEKRKLAKIIKENIKDEKLKKESFGSVRAGIASGRQRTDLLAVSQIPKLRGVVPQPLLDMYRDMETRQKRMNKLFLAADKKSKATSAASDTKRFNIGDVVELSWYGKTRQGKVVDADVKGGKVKINIEGLGDRMLPQDRVKINKKFFQVKKK